MKIKSKSTGKIYDVEIQRSGENRAVCPECSQDRKKKSAKPFSFNRSLGVGKCQHCGVVFFEYKEPAAKREYKVPEWKNRTQLTDRALSYLSGRMLSADTLNAMNISSAAEWMPQTGKDESVICFPYYRAGKLVNIKYRDGAKNFKMVKDAELILYNLDSLQGYSEAVIVEGEIDALSMIEAGIRNVVSVPNGAGSANLEYLDNCFEELAGLEKIYIAVDNDAPGLKLREELIRRFGAERCAVVTFDDCKDANEYLVKRGGLELSRVLQSAVDVPVDGVHSAGDFYDEIYDLWRNGMQPGAGIGIPEIDGLITWVTGRLAVFTGIPGHGKSEIVDYIVTLLNIIHGWKVAYFSPENHPLSYHYSKLASKISGKSFSSDFLKEAEFKTVFEYIDQNYFFIAPEDDLTIESIIEKARYLVRKRGIKVLVVDPYNKLEHLSSSGESETQYISRFLDKLTNFARINGVLVVLVAHPRKMQQKKDKPGIYEMPTLYDINGSANFFNKSDFGVVVYRDKEAGTVRISVQKVKFKHWGATGEAEFNYNTANGRLYAPGHSPVFESYLQIKPQEYTQQQIFTDDEEAPF